MRFRSGSTSMFSKSCIFYGGYKKLLTRWMISLAWGLAEPPEQSWIPASVKCQPREQQSCKTCSFVFKRYKYNTEHDRLRNRRWWEELVPYWYCTIWITSHSCELWWSWGTLGISMESVVLKLKSVEEIFCLPPQMGLEPALAERYLNGS